MSFNFGNFNFSNLDLSGLDADYFANLAKTAAPTAPTAPTAPVDPIQEAINKVAPPVSTITPTAVVPKVDSLDQAITPIASNRTTTQLFPDYAPATPEVAVAAPVAPTSWVSGGSPNLNSEGIDLNKQIATNAYGGALKYSQLSPEDQAVVDARRKAEQAVSTTGATPYQGVERQNFGVGTQYETPDEALSALPTYLGSLSQQSKPVDEQYNLRNYDPMEFVRAGFTSTPGSVSKAASVDSAVDYLTKNKVPMSKEIDGETRYLTTGLGSDVLFETIGKKVALKQKAVIKS